MINTSWSELLRDVRNVIIVGGALGKQRYIKPRENWIICGTNNSALNPDITFICQEDYRQPQFNVSGCKLGVFFEGNDEMWNGWKDLCNSLNVPCFRYCGDLHLEDCPLSPEWNWLSELHQEMDTKPLTGLVPVRLFTEVLKGSRWLEMTGYNFYLNQNTNEIPYRLGTHKIPQQVDWLRRQVDKYNILLRPEMTPLIERRHWWTEPKKICLQDFINRIAQSSGYALDA